MLLNSNKPEKIQQITKVKRLCSILLQTGLSFSFLVCIWRCVITIYPTFLSSSLQVVLQRFCKICLCFTLFKWTELAVKLHSLNCWCFQGLTLTFTTRDEIKRRQVYLIRSTHSTHEVFLSLCYSCMCPFFNLPA